MIVPSALEIHLLGPFRIAVDGREVEGRPTRYRVLVLTSWDRGHE